jgi:hypothetical protein
MPDDDHARARILISQELVEGIAATERKWLDRHLETCAECAVLEDATGRAIGSLRAVPIPLPPDLAGRTQFRVYLRTREIQRRERSGWVLWGSFALSWVLGIASAPLVWRGFEWAGRLAGLPTVWLKLTFGLWWGVPAAIAAGIWAIEKRRIEER